MKEEEKSFIDKSSWGDGPWQTEPDRIVWKDQATGLPCLLRRQENHGAWCGYVGVDETHPLYKVDHDDAHGLRAHGGVNFSSMCQEDAENGVCHVPDPGEPEHVWWFGFDCSHGFDYSPAYECRFPLELRTEWTYRDLRYAKDQCVNLALQLAARKANASIE